MLQRPRLLCPPVGVNVRSAGRFPVTDERSRAGGRDCGLRYFVNSASPVICRRWKGKTILQIASTHLRRVLWQPGNAYTDTQCNTPTYRWTAIIFGSFGSLSWITGEQTGVSRVSKERCGCLCVLLIN